MYIVCKRDNYVKMVKKANRLLNPRSLEGGGGRVKETPLDFFGFKFLQVDRLAKTLVQLFFVR